MNESTLLIWKGTLWSVNRYEQKPKQRQPSTGTPVHKVHRHHNPFFLLDVVE